jgi:hypothetical protein
MDFFIEAARAGGWSAPSPLDPVPKPGMVYVIARGPERIEVEISNGGIPHKVRRTDADGHTTVLGSAYFTMAEVLGWMGERSRQRVTDEGEDNG